MNQIIIPCWNPVQHFLRFSQTTSDANDDGGGRSRSGSGSGGSPGGSEGSSVKDLMLDRLRHLSHLSTITENQNSPYSTNPGTRRNSRSRPSYPTAEAIFNQVCMSTEEGV